MRHLFHAALCGLCLLTPAPAPASSFLDRKMGDWLDTLERGAKPEARRSAAFALGRMGRDATLALSALAKRAETDKDPGVRDMAASAIGSILMDLPPGSAARYWDEAGKAMEQSLEDKDPRVRRSAAYAIGAFGRPGLTAAAALRKATRDRDPAVRQNAAWALGRAGGVERPTIVDLCDLLADPNAMVRRDAAGALEQLGKKGGRKGVRTAAKPLLDMVKAEKDDVARKTALNALATLSGPEHRDHAADLYPLLDSKDEDTARGAAYVLGNMGGDPAKRALSVLKKALAAADPTVQSLAAASLANAGPEAAEAVDDLAKVLDTSKDPVVRQNCCVALSHLGPEAKKAIPALTAAMKPVANAGRAQEEVREYAAEAIAQLRYPHNLDAIEAVRDTLAKDLNQVVRQRCVWAIFNNPDLDKYGLTKVLTEVLEEKGDPSLMVRYDSARVLAFTLREDAPPRTVDVLLHMIRNKKLLVFNKTDASIAGAGNEANAGSSDLAPDLGGDARYMAAEALGRLRNKAKDDKRVVDALREAVKDKDERLKKAADEAIKELGIGD